MQLPRKMSAQNMMASISRTLRTRSDSKSVTANEVKLAGEESKDKLYEPKHKQKLVRVLTVVAYIISVSLAAIILSLYYMYIWVPQDSPVNGTVKANRTESPDLTVSVSGDADTTTVIPSQMYQATTGNSTTTTEESMPEEPPVTHQPLEELRKQDETERAETKPEELIYGVENAREIMKNRK